MAIVLIERSATPACHLIKLQAVFLFRWKMEEVPQIREEVHSYILSWGTMAAKPPHCCPKYVVPVDMALECVYKCCSSSVTMDFVHLLKDGTSLPQIVRVPSWQFSFMQRETSWNGWCFLEKCVPECKCRYMEVT